jgi:uncharacterized protein (DUF2147 family)
MPFSTLLLFLALSAGAGPSVASSAGVEGYWKAPSGAIVHVHPCGRDVCLKIVKLSPTIPDKTDTYNPDRGLRSRPLCSLDIGTGFRPANANRLIDGHLYDPESGHTYSGTIVTSGDEMMLRGYIGIPLFGRTEIWHRTSAVNESDCH